MGHEGHHHEEKKPLAIFASPLNEGGHAHEGHVRSHSSHSSDVEAQQKPVDPHTTTEVPFENQDCSLHENPAFHRHAEATTAELFYDLFFVANLTTFTSMLEINDKDSLTAYVGFFSLLWLTWYQVSLYDVRFSSDSVFERVAKAIHFGVMVGFAVIGPQWKPGQYIDEYKIYKAFGLILMVSRITLFLQYTITLLFTRKYTKTILPILLIMGSTLLAAILYGALTPVFPKEKFSKELDEYGYDKPIEQKSNVYIAWYIIAICETILTVAVSCFFRVISFKGTHMVQRMSLLTLIILGEGIIVICKSISKIVKNEYLWTAAVTGQIIAAVLIIYFLYMLYFDRMQEEHFGTIKQQLWSFTHFPLHVVLVLVLQGISLLIIWTQAIQGLDSTWIDLYDTAVYENYTDGADLFYAMNQTAYINVYAFVPKGVEASKEIESLTKGLYQMQDAYDSAAKDQNNQTATEEYAKGFDVVWSACSKTIFDSLSVTIPKKKSKTVEKLGSESQLGAYVQVFELVFSYVFISAGFSLIITTFLGGLSLPAAERRLSQYIRLGINLLCGIALSLLATMKYHKTPWGNYMLSPWMIATICLVYFLCIVINHIHLPKRKAH